MTLSFSRLFRLWAATAAASYLAIAGSGCVVHDVNLNPVPSLVTAESTSAATEGSDSVKPWWESFESEPLDSLIEDSLRKNPDVRSLAHRIDQANARLVQAGSTLFPQLDIESEFETSRNRNRNGAQESALGLDLSWEIDVWGRIRSGQSARREEIEVAREDWLAARLLLTGAVSETWFSLLEQYGQLRLVENQIELNRTFLELARLRFGQGQSSIVDVRQQQEQLQSTESRLPGIEFQIGELELTLDTLTGSVPSLKKAKRNQGKPDMPSPPDAGYRSDLLDNRPDLRARRAAIRALDHEVAEAIADCLPRFTLGGSGALVGSPNLDTLIGNAIAGAVGPILDGGNRRAEVAKRRARIEEELDLFTADYLNAVREVETAILGEIKITEKLRRQEAQLKTATMLLSESRSQYSLGLTDYLPVLDALSRTQDLERDVLTTRRERFSARVFLHLALGGPIPDPVR